MTTSLTTPDARVDELVRTITAADAAYATGSSDLTDAAYDELRDELAALLAEHPSLTPSPNPLDTMWEPEVLQDAVRHRRPMLSLAKIKPEDHAAGVVSFATSFAGQPFLVMPKLDGVSASVIYREGVLHRIATRGNGTDGEDITELASVVVQNLPASISLLGEVEIRGEIVMHRSTLAAHNASVEAGGTGRVLMNARNATAGVLSLKDPAAAATRPLHLYAFDLDLDGDSHAGLALRDELVALGFDTPAIEAVRATSPQESTTEILALIGRYDDARSDHDFDTDGVVIRVADPAVYAAAGARSKTVRAAVAVKFAPETRQTVLLDVVWPVGGGGKVPPRAVLEPVLVGGTWVSSGTLGNQRVIRERGLRLGMTVTVFRAGEVIPFVAGPAPGHEGGGHGDIPIPTHCPSCAEPLTVEGNSDELYCRSLGCPAQGERRLIHWAGRSAADMEAVGGSWISRLYADGLLSTAADFYALTEDALLTYRGMGPASAKRFIGAVTDSKGMGMRRALIGFGIRHANEGTAKRLCQAGYPDVRAVAAATSEELQAIRDIGPTVAGSLVEFFARPATVELLDRLDAAGVNLTCLPEDQPVEMPEGGGPLSGQTLVVTGAVVDPATGEKVDRKTFERRLTSLGATIASSVSSKTTALVCGNNVGASKTGKAEALGVRVADQAEMWDLLAEQGA